MNKNFNYRIFYGHHGHRQKEVFDEQTLCHWIDLPLCTQSYAKKNIKDYSFSNEAHFLIDKNYAPWADWFEYTGYPSVEIHKQSTLFNETTLCLSAAQSNSGITIGDSLLALPLIQSGELIMPFPHGIKSAETYSLFKEKNGTQSPAEKLFERWLFDEIETYQSKVTQLLADKGINVIER